MVSEWFSWCTPIGMVCVRGVHTNASENAKYSSNQALLQQARQPAMKRTRIKWHPAPNSVASQVGAPFGEGSLCSPVPPREMQR